MTVKGLEPEVQRIIQRHQQEMSEMRAWHADEIREMEERYARKQTMQLQELRDAFSREKEEACRREREMAQKRFESELQRLAEDFETQKRRIFNEMQDERNHFAAAETKFRDLMQENVRKAQIKGEVEVSLLPEEHHNWSTSQ
jgi:5-azacytidine-induced protein 1